MTKLAIFIGILGLASVMFANAPITNAKQAGTRTLDARPLLKPIIQYRGVDASFVPWYESSGVEYFDELGNQADPIELLSARGMNLLRIRVFVDPPNGRNGLADLLELATRGHGAGMDILVDLHYSDVWADPGNQNKPVAWASLSDQDLSIQVRTYTRDVIQALYAQNTPPAIVQIGNEITPGMLWPTGQISVNGFSGLATILNAGIAGVQDATPINTPEHDRPKIMIHIDKGANLNTSQWFYDGIIAQGVKFDMIGLSFYPWWHGTINDMSTTLTGLTNRYAKPILLVEVAYPWTLGWNDNTHNFVGLPEHLVPEFPASPNGQHQYLDMLTKKLHKIDNGLGIGWCYWGAAFVADPLTPGTPWENLSLFDFSHRILEAARNP